MLALVIVALTGAGCVPSAAWLPDSSGFIFIDKFQGKKGTRLVRYDIKSKKRTVLVENTNTETLLPGVSPDGKKVAVALSKVSYTKGSPNIPKTFQVILYDPEGK